jgi:hypothetical protein
MVLSGLGPSCARQSCNLHPLMMPCCRVLTSVLSPACSRHRGPYKHNDYDVPLTTSQLRYRSPMDEQVPLYMAQMWTSEDDRLLCCLMAEFSENMGLVADVYISTRRLEGMYFELATTMERIRNIAKVRHQLHFLWSVLYCRGIM